MRYVAPRGARAVVVAFVAAAALSPCGTAAAAQPGEIPAPPGTNPGQRGWEKVTPADKGGVDIGGASYDTKSRAADDGETLLFTSSAAFGDSLGAPYPAYYLARRDNGVWGVRSATPPSVATPAQWVGAGAGRTATILQVDGTLRERLVETAAPVTPGIISGVPALLRERAGADGYRLLTPGAPGLGLAIAGSQLMYVNLAPLFEVATPDNSHVLFSSGWDFPADPSNYDPYDPSRIAGGSILYMSVDGSVRPIGRLPDRSIAPTAHAGSAFVSTDNAISRDGRRVYFMASATSAGPLYMTDTATEETTEIDPGDGTFFTATPDGSKALWMQYLGGHLFLFDAETRTSEEISVDRELLDGDGAAVVTVLAAAEDLSRVYFTADGDIVAGQTPTGPDRAIYRWTRDGGVEHVATLAADQDVTQTGPGTFPYAAIPGYSIWRNQPFMAWNADASTFAFDTSARVTDYDPRGFRQVYLIRAGDRAPVCISCPSGEPRADSFVRARLVGVGTHSRPLGPRGNVSTDGSRVFFEAGDALVPEDTNGRSDVYVWENGRAHLVSSGDKGHDARFVSASGNGDDVFFATAARLVRADTDELVDVYDARIGGGLPEPADAPGPCDPASTCQPPATPAPRVPVPGSANANGPGDPPAPPEPRITVAKLGRRQLGRLARGQAVTLVVRSNTDGTVAAVGTARIGRRQRIVARSTRTVRAGSRARLTLRLSAQARRTLRARRRMRVTLAVALDSATDPRVMRLTLRAPARSDRARGSRTARPEAR